MQHLDEGTIHAWLDGALSPEEAARAEAHVASCSRCAEATAEARGLVAASSRILTALDNVPTVRVSPGTVVRRRSLTTWLVREKIAAVVTLVVAGGALALVMSRDTQQAAEVDLASEPIRTFEVAAADSPAPPPVAGERSANQNAESVRPAVRVTSPSAAPQAMATTGEAAPAAPPSVGQQEPTLIADAAPLSTPRTNDSLRSVTVAQAERAEARDASAEATSSVAGKTSGAATRRRALDAPARLAEPRAGGPAPGTPGVAFGLTEGPRLVQEEKTIESGHEVRRRIYSVDGILVTLDELSPSVLELEQRRAASANEARQDTAAVSTTIRWTDASGRQFTLSGAAPAERLERIRKLLGL